MIAVAPRRLAGLAGAAFLSVALGLTAGSSVSLARLTDAAAAGGNTFTTGHWSRVDLHLHNNPTPPTGNTTAQFNLAMDASAATATTLRNYDTNCDNATGRDMLRTSLGANETGTCYYANWRTAVLTSPLAINGSASLAIWSGVRNFRTGRSGALTAYLRDYNPGTNSFATITSATLTLANWQGGFGGWVLATMAFPSVSYTVPTGHRLELKVVAPTAAGRTMWIAYDTSAYDSVLTLP